MTPFQADADRTIEHVGYGNVRIPLDEPFPVKAGEWYALCVDPWDEPPTAHVMELRAKDRTEALLRCGLVELPVAQRTEDKTP